MRTVGHIFLLLAMLVLPGVSHAEARQLFNGHDLSGWEHIGFGQFVVENGLLHPKGGIGLLWFKGPKIGDAVIRVVYKVNSRKDNSGVFIRIPDPPEDEWGPVNTALEVQINEAAESDYFCTGSIYTLSKAVSRPTKIGEWNTMDITLDGSRTVVHINGVLVTDYKDGDPVPPKKHESDPNRGPRPKRGYLALQNHPQGSTVYFKEISVRPLSK
jgi:hypothetical protein